MLVQKEQKLSTFTCFKDNEKKETMISDCSEMRTEGTSRPSAGLVGTTRDGHLPVSIPEVMILTILKLAMAILQQKACFRGRTHDSEAQSQIAAGSTWQIFGGPARRIRSAGSEIETLENHFVNKSLPY